MTEQEEFGTFEERAEAMLSHVFGGMHHVCHLKKEMGDCAFWTCIHSGTLSTFDFDLLTRLVLAAHEYCLRVSVGNGGPNRLKIWVHNRKGREGSMYERHPAIEEAIAKWNALNS